MFINPQANVPTASVFGSTLSPTTGAATVVTSVNGVSLLTLNSGTLVAAYNSNLENVFSLANTTGAFALTGGTLEAQNSMTFSNPVTFNNSDIQFGGGSTSVNAPLSFVGGSVTLNGVDVIGDNVTSTINPGGDLGGMAITGLITRPRPLWPPA